ncbi:hypothetical protein [Nocardioides plantarum]|uniref:Uncharacterized protein n=1 Tax=Nocardioides plantarum TaxID=29299 RepID=A0ABV5KG04_9ACTN|nr:hypothetical protein [Nocardioides plantarum]
MATPAGRHRVRFRGQIAGVGTTSGTRIVVGRWDDTPLGSFADAMVERPDGHRLLLASHPDVARLVAATYEFDEIRVERFGVLVGPHGWQVRSDSLELDVAVGGVTVLGRLLSVVPDRVATATWWCALTDVVARTVLTGVRTRGEIGERREWYGATAHHRIESASGTFDGETLGTLAPVDPPPRFGFSSTPPRPSVTDVVTTIELDRSVALVGPSTYAACSRARE